MDEQQDEDGFPIACAANAGTVYLDELGILWVCEYEPHPEVNDYVWRSLGPAGQ
jgi:hypothetical protein